MHCHSIIRTSQKLIFQEKLFHFHNSFLSFRLVGLMLVSVCLHCIGTHIKRVLAAALSAAAII